MTRKNYRYSLDRQDAKIAGVCSAIGGRIGIDPTFVRIGFVAAAIFTSFIWTLVVYAAAGIFLTVQKKRELDRSIAPPMSDFDRMAEVSRQRPSVHAMLQKFDETDRRLMAIDHHLSQSKNDELAREIEALREDK